MAKLKAQARATVDVGIPKKKQNKEKNCFHLIFVYNSFFLYNETTFVAEIECIGCLVH